MTVREIARSAAALLQAEETEALLGGDTEAVMADEDVKTLVHCVNTAAEYAAADGFARIYRERLYASGKRIEADAFARKPFYVKSVKGGYGRVRFYFDGSTLEVPHDGEYSVEYGTEPEAAELDGEVELGEGASIGMLAFLAARDYCLVTGRTDEAQTWDGLYGALAESRRMARRAKMPCRSWR